MGRRILPRADRSVRRLTASRASVAGAFGLPLLPLTTTGRRSGHERVSPLVYATQDGDPVVIGSNWGRHGHPAWALNLQADPRARVQMRAAPFEVTARLLEGDEWDEAWRLLSLVWAHFDEYARRAAGREFLVFRLAPASPDG